MLREKKIMDLEQWDTCGLNYRSLTYLNACLCFLSTSTILPCSQYSTITYNSCLGSLVVHAPKTLTILGCDPKWIMIFNSDIKFSTAILSGLEWSVLTATVVLVSSLVILALRTLPKNPSPNGSKIESFLCKFEHKKILKKISTLKLQSFKRHFPLGFVIRQHLCILGFLKLCHILTD